MYSCILQICLDAARVCEDRWRRVTHSPCVVFRNAGRMPAQGRTFLQVSPYAPKLLPVRTIIIIIVISFILGSDLSSLRCKVCQTMRREHYVSFLHLLQTSNSTFSSSVRSVNIEVLFAIVFAFSNAIPMSLRCPFQDSVIYRRLTLVTIFPRLTASLISLALCVFVRFRSVNEKLETDEDCRVNMDQINEFKCYDTAGNICKWYRNDSIEHKPISVMKNTVFSLLKLK